MSSINDIVLNFIIVTHEINPINNYSRKFTYSFTEGMIFHFITYFQQSSVV